MVHYKLQDCKINANIYGQFLFKKIIIKYKKDIMLRKFMFNNSMLTFNEC